MIDGPTAGLAKLSSDHDVRATAFARDASPDEPLGELARALRNPSSTNQPARSSTDWTPALALALKLPDDAPLVAWFS